jgi:hypothetical protein
VRRNECHRLLSCTSRASPSPSPISSTVAITVYVSVNRTAGQNIRWSSTAV